MSVSDEQAKDNGWLTRWGARERNWTVSGLGPRPGQATTPISGWKFYNRDSAGMGGAGGVVPAVVSSRRLAVKLWQSAVMTNCSGDVRWQCGLSDQLGFEFCTQIPKFTTEGIAKWDHGSKASHDVKETSRPSAKFFDNQLLMATISAASKYRKRRKEPKAEHTMLEILKDLTDDVSRERKSCENMYIWNSKLAGDIYEARLLATKFMHKYEKEKKARQSLENVCMELNKKIEAKKDETRELRIQNARIQEEVENEKKILQITEAWREERARMKLVDAKSILEDKYNEMNNLIADVKAFLGSSTI